MFKLREIIFVGVMICFISVAWSHILSVQLCTTKLNTATQVLHAVGLIKSLYYFLALIFLTAAKPLQQIHRR